jgi:hypothetical protein
MKLNFDLNTPIWQLTAGDLLDLLERGNKPVVTIDTVVKNDKSYV